jgi:hypothetical protein
MERTATTKLADQINAAKGYISLSDGTHWGVPEPEDEDGKILAGALVIKSCVRALLKYYIALMHVVSS